MLLQSKIRIVLSVNVYLCYVPKSDIFEEHLGKNTELF